LRLFFALFAVKSFSLTYTPHNMRNSDLTPEVIGAAIKVHRRLGPGLHESAYEACLAHEIEQMRLRVERQKPVPLVYETVKMDCGFRADLVIEGKLVVEIKCKEAIHPVDEAQLLSHLRLLNLPVGLLMNFHVFSKDGITRMVNNYREPIDIARRSF
jgi:GxxExxY protein